MLRDLVALVAAGLVVLTGAGVVLGGLGLIGPFAVCVLLLVGTVWERVRYKQVTAAAPGGRFRRTAERFRDPTTGEPVTVYADPATGERAYVRE